MGAKGSQRESALVRFYDFESFSSSYRIMPAASTVASHEKLTTTTPNHQRINFTGMEDCAVPPKVSLNP